jgi:lactose/L-arabinose transport system ATP-binding protein
MVYVTHDQVEAMTLADRIVVLRAGRIEQQGTPIELYDNPDNTFVAGFIGSPRMNFLDAEVAAANGREVDVKLAGYGQPVLKLIARTDRARPSDKALVGIRPEHFVAAGDAHSRIVAQAQVVEQLGGVSYVYANDDGDSQITVQQHGHSRMENGSRVEFGIDPSTTLLFDHTGQRL